MFAPLPAQTLERLASELRPVSLRPAQTLFRRGDAGDRFYVVASGSVDVAVDGRVQPLGPGECFGEIALLRDVPRTATVAASASGAELYALERDEFVAAVTGHPESASAAEAVVTERLSPLRAAGT